MSENQGVFLAVAVGCACGGALAGGMVLDVGPAAWGLLPLLVWVAHTMVDVIVRELGAYLHAQKKLADQRLLEATRDLDDHLVEILEKCWAEGQCVVHVEPDPIDVHHDPVGIDGSCIRVR